MIGIMPVTVIMIKQYRNSSMALVVTRIMYDSVLITLEPTNPSILTLSACVCPVTISLLVAIIGPASHDVV